MNTHYFQPLPPIPAGVLDYCAEHHYTLSLKKQYIIAQIVRLEKATDIDTLIMNISLYCSGVSKSSVYLVLQWMIGHDLIIRINTGDTLRVLYQTNAEKLATLSPYISLRSNMGAQPNKLGHVA